MSMICILRRVSDPDLKRLRAKPHAIESFLAEGSGEAEDSPPPSGLLARFLRWLGRAEGAVSRAWTPRSEGDECDLDKAWHGLHFLLTGTAFEGGGPEGYLLTGGTEIGAGDLGYGPPRLLSREEVAAFSAHLATLDRPSLRRAFDPRRMQEVDIYPTAWSEETEEEDFDYLWAYFGDLRAFVAEAAGRGDAVVVYLA